MVKQFVFWVILLVLPGVGSAQPNPPFQILSWIDNQWTVIDSNGAFVRVLPVVPSDAPSVFSLSHDESKLLFLIRNWQTWEYDFSSGLSRFLSQTDWNSASTWLPGSTTEFVFNDASGRLLKFDTLSGNQTVWQSNDVIGGRVYTRVEFGGLTRAVFNVHYGGAGGMGVYLGDVCNVDAVHALCNVRPLAWPGNGSSSWSTVAGGAVLSRDGSRSVYFERHGTNGAIYLHDIPSDSRVQLLSWSSASEAAGGAYGPYLDRYVVVNAQSRLHANSAAYFVCDMQEVSCREIISRPGVYGLNHAVVARSFGDAEPPTIAGPLGISREAESASGVSVQFAVTAEDNVDEDVLISCMPASNSVFPIGTTQVRCSASDTAGNTTTYEFEVKVADTTAPTIDGPADLTIEASGAAGATVHFSVVADDTVSGPLSVSCSSASGSVFALGSTTVNCQARDAAGNVATHSFVVNVVDTTEPTIASVSPSRTLLWPPNNKMVPVSFTVQATDSVSAPECTVTGIAATLPLGNGDWSITGPLSVVLRAKRPGSGAMTYTVTVTCTDGPNASSAVTTIIVPHDQGN